MGFFNRNKNDNDDEYLLNNPIVFENIDWNKRFVEKYSSSNPYANGLSYDGFNFIIVKGSQIGNYLCNILQLKKVYENLKEITQYLCLGGDFETICKDYNLNSNPNHMSLKRILITLILEKTVFISRLNELSDYHLYELKQDEIYIDEYKTGLKTDYLNYIKSCLENTNNKYETIKNFMEYYKEINNKYIRIICCNIEKIPNKWLTTTPTIRVENDTKWRF